MAAVRGARAAGGRPGVGVRLIPHRLSAALADRYRLEREIGQGGMATVYLAQDLRHQRPVAVKVLRDTLASTVGAERFLAEIRTTAGLQHPHILALHDSGSADGILYYVMPYIEGESLRDRLEREGQLPIEDALRITTEIAGALDYAHRKGIIHRDIKPENILLHEGRALVADFGIALAASQVGAERLTGTGLSLGTPLYMSPEQAMGERKLTAQSDIYALGCVAYEMLAGTPPHTGPTAQAVVARALHDAAPRIRPVRPAVSPAVESAVLKALERVPADRWRSAAEFAAGLTGGAGVRSTRRGPRLLPLAVVAALVLLGVVGAWAARRLGGGAGHAPSARLVIPLDAGHALAPDALPFEISPDGSTIVYVGESGGRRQLFLRELASFEARAIPGTDGARQPFFSPDGRWIGFTAGGNLQKVARDGGAPIVLAPVRETWGADWGSDGTILYAAREAGLFRVSDAGGTPRRIDAAAPVRWPRLLPDGQHALVSAADDVAVLTLATGELRTLFPGRQARYLPTGHLLFDEGEGRIRVVPFDARRLAVTGTPSPAFEAFRSPGSGSSHFAVSANGTLVYVAGGFERSLVLTDDAGRATPIPLPPRGYRFPRFAPDGERVAVTVDPRPSQIWLVDLRRESAVPVVTGRHSILPVWSPDGGTLAFMQQGLRAIRPPATDSAALLLAPRSGANVYPSGWAPGGGILAELADTLGRHVAYLAPGDSAITQLTPPGLSAWAPAASPDGASIAYVSDISGVAAVYARRFGGSGEAILVSAEGGTDPHWTGDGRAIVYRNGAQIMRADLRAGPALELAGRPRQLFEAAFDFSQAGNWDLSRDGRFVFVRGDPATVGRLMVVTGWFDEIGR